MAPRRPLTRLSGTVRSNAHAMLASMARPSRVSRWDVLPKLSSQGGDTS